MSTIVLRVGGPELTNAQIDANVTNLNNDKLEKSGGTMTGFLTLVSSDPTAALHAVPKSYVDAHMNDTVDAHDASAISNVAAGGIVATDVQAAINELDGAKLAKAGDTMSGRLFISYNNPNGITTVGGAGQLELINLDAGSMGFAGITFHDDTAFAFNFGLDTSIDNFLRIGGWSMGAVSYRVVHEGLAKVRINNAAATVNDEAFNAGGAIRALTPTAGLPHATNSEADAAVAVRVHTGGAWLLDAGNNNGPGWLQVRTSSATAPTYTYLMLQPRGGNVAVNTTTETTSIFGTAVAYALNVNGDLYANSIATKGNAAVFARDATGSGALSSLQSALQVGLHSTDNADSLAAGAGPSVLYFGYDDANPPVKQFIGRFSGYVESGAAGTFYGGVSVNVRANNGDSSATTIAARWTASTNYLGEGYQRLGSGAPLIKMKKLTGTTASAENGTVTVAHGLTASKIISHTAVVNRGDGIYMPPEHSYNSEHQFSTHYDGTNFTVSNHATNSANILSKAFTILVTYEE